MNVTEEQPPAPPNEVEENGGGDEDGGHECPNCGSPNAYVKVVPMQINKPLSVGSGRIEGIVPMPTLHCRVCGAKVPAFNLEEALDQYSETMGPMLDDMRKHYFEMKAKQKALAADLHRHVRKFRHHTIFSFVGALLSSFFMGLSSVVWFHKPFPPHWIVFVQAVLWIGLIAVTLFAANLNMKRFFILLLPNPEPDDTVLSEEKAEATTESKEKTSSPGNKSAVSDV